MDALVVGFDGDVIDDLEIKGDSDAACFTVWVREETVVVAAAAAEAGAAAGEGETGDEDDVEGGDFEARAVGFGFPDVHLAALEVVE